MSDVIDEHRLYLSDGPRLRAYEAALRAVISPGDVAVDLGAGTGIWGLLACRAGAARVYSIEQTSLIGLTRKIARDNDYGDRVICLNQFSTQVDLPEKADVICCDQIGRFGFEAGVFGYFADAARRFAAADARFVPSHIEFYAAPVSLGERAAHVEFWDSAVCDFDFSALAPIARNSGYPARLEEENLLADAPRLARQPTTSDESFKGEMETVVTRAGRLDGLGCWFRAQLAPGIFVSNAPSDPDRIKRRNTFLPVEESVEVVEGDRVKVAMHFIPRETLLSWTATVTRANGEVVAHSRHSTFEGMFLTPKDLSKTSPENVPTLSERGRARRTVLELCDGKRTLGEIENEAWGQHPGLFPSSREASLFVAEVVTRYSQ